MSKPDDQIAAILARLDALESQAQPALARPSQPATTRAASVLVECHNGRVVTNSLTVAQRFGKRHEFVQREIERLWAEGEADFARHIEYQSASEADGNLAPSPWYRLTKDGFLLVAMAFPGKVATRRKLAFIRDFDQAEQAERERVAPKRVVALAPLSPAADGEAPDLVQSADGQIMTTSLVVAERFGKRHDTVLRAIRNIECSESFHLRNFAESSYLNEQGKSQPLYTMTKDGFMFLAMGFTGREAAHWKEAFIDAFNRMEQALRERPASSDHHKPADAACHQHDNELLIFLEVVRSRLPRRLDGSKSHALSLNTALVLRWLWNFCLLEGVWFPINRSQIAREIEVDSSVVRRAMRRLMRWGFLVETSEILSDGIQVKCRLERPIVQLAMQLAERKVFALLPPTDANEGLLDIH